MMLYSLCTRAVQRSATSTLFALHTAQEGSIDVLLFQSNRRQSMHKSEMHNLHANPLQPGQIKQPIGIQPTACRSVDTLLDNCVRLFMTTLGLRDAPASLCMQSLDLLRQGEPYGKSTTVHCIHCACN